jgi:hypothetical protein
VSNIIYEKGLIMDLDFLHMPLQDLFKYRETLKDQIQVLKDKQAVLNEDLAVRFGNTARNKLNDNGKDYGTVTLNEQGYKVKVTLKQRVSWNQEGLAQALMSMNEDDARHYARITYGIDERKYNNAPPAIKAKLQEHRTVELTGTSVDITEGTNGS